jgi:alpha-tubulin suppressor-like RCC1 family protein
VGKNTNWVQVDSAADHSCAVKSDLTLWCWGNNVSGDLGYDGGESDAPFQLPQKIWTEATTFDSMSCAWKTDSTMACWGNDAVGQLGDGSPVPSRPGPVSVVIVPA